MENKTTIKISGIKCDNPKCDFADSSVAFEDYKDYVNQPCPLCGENLLTKKDYRNCKRLVRITNIINRFNLNSGENTVSLSFEMNGTGKINIKDINIE